MSSASGIKAGRAWVELGVNDKFSGALKAAQKQLKAYGASVRMAGYAISAAATAAAAPLVASVKVFSSAGDAVAKAAKRTGLSTEAMSELGFAAEQSGTNVEGLEKGLRAMQKNVTDAAAGTGEAADALKLLGLSANTLLSLSPEEMFMAIAAEIGKIEDPTRRAAAAMDIFGARIGTGLLPLMAEGEAGIAALRKQARDFGISVGSKDAKSAEELNDAMNLAQRSVRGLMMQIGKALAPAVTDLSTRFAGVVATAGRWIEQNRGAIVVAAKVIAVVGAVGATLISLGVTLSALGMVASGLATAFGVAVAAVAAIVSPIGLVTVGALAAAAAVLYFSGAGGEALEWLRDRFGELKDRVTEVVGGIVSALKAGDMELAARIAWLAVKAAWIAGTGWLTQVWEDFKAWFLKTALDAAQALEDFFGPDIWYPLEVAAVETIATLSRLWTTFAALMRSTFEKVTGWIGDRALEVQGIFDSDLDVEEAKRRRRATDDHNLEKIEQERQNDISGIDERLAKRRAAAEARELERLNTGRSWIGGARDAVDDARARALAENDLEVAAAMDELRRSIDMANRLAKTPPVESRKAEEMRSGHQVARMAAGMNRGTFSTSSAATLALQSGSSERRLAEIATAAKTTASEIKAFRREARNNAVAPGVFT